MEEVGASNQSRLHFSKELYRTYLGLVFPPEENIVTLQFLVNTFFSGVVSTRSSIFTVDRFSDYSDGCYSSGPSTVQRYLREFWHPVTQMWEAYIPVPPR